MTDDDDVGRLLVASVNAATWHNKMGYSKCPICLGLRFLDLNEFFKHMGRHNHPSTGRAS